MQRAVVFTALLLPALVGAFIAGIIFERQRHEAAGDGAVAARSAQPPSPVASRPAEGNAPTREQRVSASAQALLSAWKSALEQEDLFAVRHSDRCYSARFIRRGGDLRGEIKGDAVIVRISGMTATTGKFSCFRSFAEALASHKRGAEDVERVDATFSYMVTGNEIRLDQARSNPEWFARVIKYNIADNPPSWSAVAQQPIRPE